MHSIVTGTAAKPMNSIKNVLLLSMHSVWSDLTHNGREVISSRKATVKGMIQGGHHMVPHELISSP